MLDRQSAFIGEDDRKQLGDWSRRRLKSVIAKEEQARKQLADCGIPINELRSHWEEQRAAQLSVCARSSYLLSNSYMTHPEIRCTDSAQERAGCGSNPSRRPGYC